MKPTEGLRTPGPTAASSPPNQRIRKRELNTKRYSVPEVLEALKSRDPEKLSEMNRQLEQRVKYGELSELAETFDLLLATAGTNEVTGLPVAIAVDPQGWEHMQRMFIESARRPVDRSHRLLLHPIEGLTEKLGELHRLGIVKLWSFEAFAGPVIGELVRVSFDSAERLRHFVDSGPKSDSTRLNPGEKQAKQFAKDTARTKLDGDIGGKKPASDSGPYQWMSRQIQSRAR